MLVCSITLVLVSLASCLTRLPEQSKRAIAERMPGMGTAPIAKAYIGVLGPNVKKSKHEHDKYLSMAYRQHHNEQHKALC